MYYLFSVDHNSKAEHPTTSDSEGFQAVMYIQRKAESDDMLWISSDEGGNVRSERRMKALTVEMETDRLAKVDRI
jgi:hypothetical protein